MKLFPRNKKGFVISLDAFVALLVLIIFIGTSVFFLGEIEYRARNSNLLKETAGDAITVLDKTGALETSVEDKSTIEIRSFLNSLPYNLCAEVFVYSETDLKNPVFVVLRTDCAKTFDDLAVIKRSFFTESDGNLNFYLAEMKMWVRETA